MKKCLGIFLGVVATFGFLNADEFDFKDPKGVNAINIKIDSPLEPIYGIGNGISGKISFDGKDGKSLKGELLLAVDSLKMPNDDMSKYTKGEMWLDAAKFPEIKISVIEVLSSTTVSENEFNLKVKTKVEIKGVAKEMELEVKATYLKDKLGQRNQKMKGDLLVLRSDFTVKRDEFNIKPGEMLQLVGNEIKISAAVTGFCSK